MPLIKPLELRRFSEHGPVPRPVSMGSGMAVMLLCLRSGQSLVAPQGDDGEGQVREGEALHTVAAGDVVHVLPGEDKALIAGAGTFTVLGVRRLERRDPRAERSAEEA